MQYLDNTVLVLVSIVSVFVSEISEDRSTLPKDLKQKKKKTKPKQTSLEESNICGVWRSLLDLFFGSNLYENFIFLMLFKTNSSLADCHFCLSFSV